MNDDENREMRTLRWRNKSLGKQLGKAGQKIHELRCALAECREINGKIARGDLRDLQRDVESKAETIAELRQHNERLADQNIELLEKLRASEKVEVDDSIYAQNQTQADAINRFIQTGE